MMQMNQWRNRMTRLALLALLAASLTGCGTVKDWFSKDEDETARLPGDRVTVMNTQTSLAVDPALASTAFRAVPPLENTAWPQRGAHPSNALGAVKVSGFKPDERTKIGKGHAWETVLATAPVVAEGVLYAMDARGYVSAHPADKLGKELWVSDVPVLDRKEPVLGGGLAVDRGFVYVSTGLGYVYALKQEDGSLLWKRNIGSPMRSAPKLQQGRVYLSTVDDQLFALDAATGAVTWQHRGLGGRVGFLSAVSPAIGENIVVVTYSSGDIYGLAADTGQELWNDSLAMTVRTSATSIFTGFDGDAVIAGGVAFASSNNGLSAATHLLTGRRIWEQEVSAADTPWLAGNFLFVVTTDGQVAAIHARDGRIKWAQQLERFENPEKQLKPYRWYGPMILGEQLAVFGGHGKAVLFSPEDGKQLGRIDIPNHLRATPIVANGTVYMVTQDARVHALR